MKLSKYSKTYPSTEVSESVVLFSTKRASAVLVPSGLLEDITNNSLSSEEQETLLELELLARDEEEEKQELLHYVRELNELDKTFKFTLVLNLDCNLGCVYCFEGKRKGKFYLSDEVEKQFIDFVTTRDYTNKEEIKAVFYGGEPLLSIEQIVSISKKIRSFAESKGLQYGFSLVTNGTLLTPAVVKRLVPLGLKSAKVTLDGPRHIHDKFRPFTSGTGSFDVIVRNIQGVCDLARINIGGNYTREHYREFPKVLDYLMAEGLTPDKIPMIKFDPVANETGEYAPQDFNDGCNSISEPWLIEASLFLREEILRRGYATAKLMPSPCLIELYDSVVVNYDGTLYKCPGLVGRKDYCVGDLKTGVKDYSASHALDVWKKEECLECAYLPLCFGGCKYMTLLATGNMQGVSCRKEYFERTLKTFVAQDIKYDL